MRPRRPSKQPPPPVPLNVQALSELRRDEIDALPFGVRGEIAPSRPAEPPPPAPPPIQIPAPDWESEAAERGEAESPIGDSPEPTHAAMFSGFYDPPEPQLGPVERVEPLTRPRFDSPDWRAEEEERAKRAAAEPPQTQTKTNRLWRTS